MILYCLIAHTTHQLQPNDVGAFSPLKHFWNKASMQFLHTNHRPLAVRDVVCVYLQVRKEAFKVDTIKAAWHKSGITVDEIGHPKCNMSIFMDADFASSISSSTQLHLPEGFPLPHSFSLLDPSTISTSSLSSSGDNDDDDEDLLSEAEEPPATPVHSLSRSPSALLSGPDSPDSSSESDYAPSNSASDEESAFTDEDSVYNELTSDDSSDVLDVEQIAALRRW